jgi:NAD+ kinase
MVETTRRVLIISHAVTEEQAESLAQAVDLLQSQGMTPVITEDQVGRAQFAQAEVYSEQMKFEAALVLGGDGSILRAAEALRGQATPILGVNLGHVGFMAEAEKEDLTTAVTALATGEYRVRSRLTLEVSVVYEGQVDYLGWALNEVTVEKSAREQMLEVTLEVDGRPLSSFGCDGVLFSTPTGSTAYAFSAGGPVVWPDVEALLAIPLSAHSLFARPLVVGPDTDLALEVSSRSAGNGVVWCDGRRTHALKPGARIEVGQSKTPVQMVILNDEAFTDRLVRKFKLPVQGWRGHRD